MPAILLAVLMVGGFPTQGPASSAVEAAAQTRPSFPSGFRSSVRITPPVVVHQEVPRYPDRARAAGVEGEVVLQVVVRTDGTVGDVRIVKGVDDRLGLDEAAVRAAKQWRFRPGTISGTPFPHVARLKMTFRIGRRVFEQPLE